MRFSILKHLPPTDAYRNSYFVDVAWDVHRPYPFLSETESYEMPATQPTGSALKYYYFSEKIG